MTDTQPDRGATALMPGFSRRAIARAIGLAGLTFGGQFGWASDDPALAKKKRRKRKRRRKNKKKKPRVRADATCAGPAETAVSAIGSARYAQTFTAGKSGPLVRAEIRSAKGENSLGDFTLRLATVNAANVPTNSVLATAFLAVDEVPVGISTLRFSFQNPFSVVAGVQYALVLTRPGSLALQVNGYSDDTCAGRAYFSQDQNDPFQESAMSDIVFTTYVKS